MYVLEKSLFFGEFKFDPREHVRLAKIQDDFVFWEISNQKYGVLGFLINHDEIPNIIQDEHGILHILGDPSKTSWFADFRKTSIKVMRLKKKNPSRSLASIADEINKDISFNKTNINHEKST